MQSLRNKSSYQRFLRSPSLTQTQKPLPKPDPGRQSWWPLHNLQGLTGILRGLSHRAVGCESNLRAPRRPEGLDRPVQVLMAGAAAYMGADVRAPRCAPLQFSLDAPSSLSPPGLSGHTTSQAQLQAAVDPMLAAAHYSWCCSHADPARVTCTLL